MEKLEQSVVMLLDTHRKRDASESEPRQSEREQKAIENLKAKTTDKHRTSKKRKCFGASEFIPNAEGTLTCPAGNRMKPKGHQYRDVSRRYTGTIYRGDPKKCAVCELRSKCMRNSTTPTRTVMILDVKPIAIEQMIERFDTSRGRYYYSRRMGAVEPVFANIRHTHGLDWFSLRGRKKVDTQWKLFCIVHNIRKIAWKRRVG